VTQTATSPQRKPLLDEASFQQLLSAAYVLQEHNDRLRGKEVHADFAKNLSAIVETQKLIQTLQLDLDAAAKLVAERVQKITDASGAAIGILEKGELVYRAGTGTAAMDAETRVAPSASLSADCLSNGSAVNYPDADVNSPARAKLFREREVKSFIAVPVYHAGQVAGVLELRFTRINSFREGDLRTAELMAGLLSDAMATAARMKWKDALASERQSMLEALERIKPQLERLGTESLSATFPSESHVVLPEAPKRATFLARVPEKCSVCGSDFFDQDESFCGICGTARPEAPPPPRVAHDVARSDGRDVPRSDVPSKISSPTITPYGAENPPNGNSRVEATATSSPTSLQELIELSAIQQNPAAHVDKHFKMREWPKAAPVAPAGSDLDARMEPDFLARASDIGLEPRNQSHQIADHQIVDQWSPPDHFAPPIESAAAAAKGGEALQIVPADPHALSDKLQPDPWGSAKKTQQWLETVKTRRGPTAEWMAHQWQTRRANIYIGLAGLILLIVISGWGIRPTSTAIAGNGSPATSGQHQAPPAPNLTLFERLLVSLGLAEAPPAPIYMGNPDTQVWVDVHTALYHCPGSDLFGKTPDGRLATQRDAQQDQFEPANRKACP
jgi:putative methionine-R-sulfoxide reductase with GAF domain